MCIEPKESYTTETEVDGIKTVITVAKVDNGYIIQKRVFPVKFDENNKEKTTTIISKDNPMKIKESVVDKSDIAESIGKLLDPVSV